MENSNQEIAKYVRALQNGDSTAFQKIYDLSYSKAYFTALKICKNQDDAEDVLQESYMHLLKKVNDIKNPEAFLSWFNMVVANQARNVLRKNSPALFESDESEEYILNSIEDGDCDFHPSTDAEQSELRDEVMELIDGLSDEKRTAVILYYYDEMTTKQIAESLGVNENTVKSRLVQAKKDLAKGLKELEKKNKSLYGIAPISLVSWALRNSAKETSKAFALSGGAATTYATVTAASTATAATATAAATGGIAAKVAGLTIAQKIISGVVIAGIVAGGAVGTKAIVSGKGKVNDKSTSAVVQTVEPTAVTVDEVLNTEAASDTTLNTIESTSVETSEQEVTTSTSAEAKPTKMSELVSSTTASTKASTSTTTTTTKTTTTKTTHQSTTTSATVGKATLNVEWISFSGDNKKGNYTLYVPEKTLITKETVTDKLKSAPYNYQSAELTRIDNIGISAESGMIYTYTVYVR